MTRHRWGFWVAHDKGLHTSVGFRTLAIELGLPRLRADFVLPIVRPWRFDGYHEWREEING